ncbi:hypothetical protein ACNKHX_06830 [Shigella flexneri]
MRDGTSSARVDSTSSFRLVTAANCGVPHCRNGYAIVYYTIFRVLIKARDLKTPVVKT